MVDPPRKRAFQRDRGVLRDEFQSYRGKTLASIAAAMEGEALEPEDRLAHLDTLRGGAVGPDFAATYALSRDKGPQVLEALLAAVEKGSMAAPMSLVPFAEDPRVRPAILRAARRAEKSEHAANVFQVLGILGGPRAVSLLRRRVKAFATDPRVDEPDAFFNRYAGELLTAAYALLRLDPEANDAADALIRLMGHPNAWNRRRAVDDSVKLLEPLLGTVALERVRAMVMTLVKDPDAQVFLAATPVLLLDTGDRESILSRVRVFLADEDLIVRAAAAHAVVRVRGLSSLFRPDELARWLDAQPIDLALEVATSGRSSMIPDAMRSVVERALACEAPSIRLGAAKLLPQLATADARRLAEAALADEPDPAIQRQLEKHAN